MPSRGPQPLSQTQHQSFGCLAPLIHAVLFISGAIVFFQFFYADFRNLIGARDWVPTPCTIVFSEFRQTPQKNTYRPEIAFTYTYGGKSYRKARIYVVNKGADNLTDIEALRRKYPVNTRTTCYVNPENPAEAVLDRSFKPFLLAAIIPVGLALIGLIGLLNRVRRFALPQEMPITAREQVHHGAAEVFHAPPPGAVTRTAPRGFGVLIFAVLFTAFWNTVISFLVREVLSHWRTGNPGCYGVFLTLFALPFAAVGAGGIVACLYLFLKLFNPRPTITLSSASLPLGGQIRIHWQFKGQTGRLRRLRVYAEGREEATYVRGTTTSTDRETFAIVRLLDTERANEIVAGNAALTIPRTTIHSFESSNNKITWVVKVHGQVPRWPDVNAEFPITVLPLPQESLVAVGESE